MKNLVNDIFNLMRSLKWVDFVFLVLVIFLIVSFIMIMYLVKVNKIVEDDEETEDEYFNLEEVTKQIENEYENLNIPRKYNYENEQEEQAIISYDELLSNTSEYHLEYDDEYPSNSEIEVKKIKQAVPIDSRYAKEEQFLEYLNNLKSK